MAGTDVAPSFTGVFVGKAGTVRCCGHLYELLRQRLIAFLNPRTDERGFAPKGWVSSCMEDSTPNKSTFTRVGP
jgi:hypothetical protein